MPFDADTLRELVAQFGYPLVAAVILAENMFLPAPSQTTVLVAGALAAGGVLDPFVLAAVVSATAFVGDNVGFAIGRFGGRPLVDRFGVRIGITPERYATAESFLTRYGGPAVVVGRFMAFVRILVPPLLGASGMSWTRFVPWDVLATALWGPTIVALGYFGVSGAAGLVRLLERRLGAWGAVLAVAAVVLVAVAVVVAARRLRHRVLRDRSA